MDKLREVRLDGHRGTLVAGREFTATMPPRGKAQRLRFHSAHIGPRGLVLTAHDGRQTRALLPEQVVRVHLPDRRKVGRGISSPPPARRRGR